MDNNLLLLLAFVLFVVMSGLFAGAETGTYQISRLRLRLGAEKKRPSYVMLGRCLQDGSGLLLAILVGNNLVNYLATSIAAGFFLGMAATSHVAELCATAVTVPVLFVFGEVLPKNLFFFRADTLMPFVSPILYAFHRILSWCGVVPVLKLISSAFTQLTGLAATSDNLITSVQRHKIHALLRETREEGILSPVQSGIVSRLVGISHVRLREVMIPMHNVETIDADSDRSAMLNKLKKCAFTRLPVAEGREGNIIGFVPIYEVLGSSKRFTNLHDFVEPITRLDAETTVTDAINVMQRDNLKIVLVTRTGRGGRDRPIGIITMKDLVEEILGELAEW
ncbi:MAG: CNNM domain-containing protein [Planctomycetota bacterium]|jgi:CBS domain containing-hemolysin-like protein